MSYRPNNFRKTGIVPVINYSYAGGAVYRVKAETRYFDPNMILYLSVPSPNNGGIYLASDDLIPNATVVSQNSNFTNVSNMFDHNDSTYAYDNGTSIGAGVEQTEIVFNLGKAYSAGFVYISFYVSSGNYQRVYVSPDNSTWTKVIDAGGTAQTYAIVIYSSNVQYIKLAYYNSNSSSLTASPSYWYTNSLEFYPVPLRTYLQGDGTVKWYNIIVYNTYYELLEVWNI